MAGRPDYWLAALHAPTRYIIYLQLCMIVTAGHLLTFIFFLKMHPGYRSIYTLPSPFIYNFLGVCSPFLFCLGGKYHLCRLPNLFDRKQAFLLSFLFFLLAQWSAAAHIQFHFCDFFAAVRGHLENFVFSFKIRSLFTDYSKSRE